MIVNQRMRRGDPLSEVGERAMLVESRLGGLILCRRGPDQWRATWRALLSHDEVQEWDWLIDGHPSDEEMRSLGRRLGRFLRGDATVSFEDVPTPVGPPFFRACWNACRKIRRGQTITYGELAQRAGSPGAMRAAGQAMRGNPLPIVVPCHRVIASDGTLGGYSGTTDPAHPALAIKRSLLEMEGALAWG